MRIPRDTKALKIEHLKMKTTELRLLMAFVWRQNDRGMWGQKQILFHQ